VNNDNFDSVAISVSNLSDCSAGDFFGSEDLILGNLIDSNLGVVRNNILINEGNDIGWLG